VAAQIKPIWAANALIRIEPASAPNGGYSRSRPTVTATVGGQLPRPSSLRQMLCKMIWVSYDRGRDVGYLYEF